MVFIRTWCVENIMLRLSLLTVEGVSEDTQGGFVALADLAAGGECGATEAFEPAEEAFDVPPASVAMLLEPSFGHLLRAVTAAEAPITAMHHGLDPALHAPDFAADAVQPIGIVTRIGQELRGQVLARRVEALVEKFHGLALVVVRPPVEHHAQRQQAAADQAQADFEIFAPLTPRAADVVRARRRRFQPRRIHGHRSFGALPGQGRATDPGQQRLGHRADFRPRAELLQRGVVRQLVLQAEHLAQRPMAREPVDHAAAAGLQTGLQDQATHPLPLRKVTPAFDRPIRRQMLLTQLHG